MSLADEIRNGDYKKKKLEPLDLTSKSKANLEKIKASRPVQQSQEPTLWDRITSFVNFSKNNSQPVNNLGQMNTVKTNSQKNAIQGPQLPQNSLSNVKGRNVGQSDISTIQNNNLKLAQKDETKDSQEMTLLQQQARKKAEKKNENITRGGVDAFNEIADSLLNAVPSGVMSASAGLGNVATTAGATVTKTANKVIKSEKLDDVYDDIVNSGRYINEKGNFLNNVNSQVENGVVRDATNVIHTVSQMATNAGIGAVTGGSGSAVQGLSVGGSSAQEVLNEDKDKIYRAGITGATKGAVAYGIEKLSDFNILTKGTKTSSIQNLVNKKIAQKFSTDFGRKVASKITGITGENVEEFLEDNIDNVIDKLVNNKEMPGFKEWISNTTETLKATTLSTIIADLLGLGGGSYQDITNEVQKNTEAQKWINEAQKIIKNEKLSLDKVINSQPTAPINNQQNQTQTEPNLPTQQTIQEQNNVAQNGNMEQIKIDSENFSKQVDAIKNGTFPQKDMLTLGKTPQALKDIGLPDLPITMTQRHLDTIMNESGKYKNANYHGLGEEIVKQLPEAINNPLDIVKSNTKDDSVVLTTYLADKQDRPVIASIKIDGKGRVNDIMIDTNVMTSAYGRNNYDKFMQDNIKNGNLLYDIDRGVIKKVTGARLQLPRTSNFSTNNGSFVNNSVPQNTNNVNNTTINNNYAQNIQNDTQNQPIPPINNTRGKLKTYNTIRSDVANANFDAESKPHGLYVSNLYDKSVDDFTYPFKDKELNTNYNFKVTPNNPLEVSESLKLDTIRGKNIEVDAGVKALQKLNKAEFEKVKTMSKSELLEYLSNKYSKYDFSKYYDNLELMSAYGGILARENGYDAIIPQKSSNSYTEDIDNEMVILKNDIYKITDNLPTKGETIGWNEIERPEGKIALQNSPKINFDNEISKTNAELKGDTNTDEKVAKILKEPIEKAKEKNRTWAILKANLIDKNLVFEELSRKANNRDLQGKADYMLSSEARGQYAIGNERFDGDKRICKSLTDIIDEVGDNVEDFYSYMYHQLNVDRMTLEDRFGGDTGINYERKESIKNKPVFGDNITAQVSKSEIQAIEKTHPEFKEYAQDVYDYLDANKKELVDKGVISKETSNLFKEMYPHYVPIQRVGKNGNSISVPLDTGRTGINNPIKRAKGGSSDILPLFETMADKTLQTYRASARNNFGVELKNTLAKLNQLSQTSNITDIDSIIDNMTDEQQNNELLQEGKNGNNPTFTVFDNGEKVTFDISQDMYEALKPRDRSSILSKTFKLPNKLSSLHRGVLTEYNPIFSITNAIKDSQDVLLNSQHSAKTYAKFPEAYVQIIGKGHWYQEYIQNGGEQNSYFKDGQFDASKTNLPTKAKNVVTYPLKAISNINNVIEMSPRLAEYIASREKGASIETAMLDASRVTTNFKAGGDVTKFANRNGATFLNASVQGFQQQVRNIQEANAKGLKGYAVLATKYAIAGVPALILNGLIWRDDDDYEKLQDYVKDNYYCIGKLSNGDFIRIPKGRVSATIQKIVSNATDFIKDGKINSDNVGKEFWNDLKEDLKFAIDNVAPNNPIDNNILAPIVQVTQNKTWYGEDLVPSRLKNLPAGEQFDESTDKLSKWLGEKTGYSPYKINYLMNQYSGGVGDVLLPMGTPQAENNVIEDKFTANPVLKNKYPGQFFEKAEELNVLNNSSKATDTDKIKYKYASEKQKEMSELYKQERDIQNSSDTDADKKKKILEVQKKINKIAENSLKDIDKIKVTGNTVKVNDIEYYKATNIKDGTKEWKEINDEEKDKKKNISLNTYATYKEDVAKETIKQRKAGNIKEEGQISDKSKINILLSSKYTDKEKADIYENFIMSKPKNNSLDTFQVIKSSKMNINEYLKYKQQEFVSDKEDDGTLNGKSVSSNEAGSKKNKFINYINSMDITGDQRILLYAMQGYETTSTQKKQLVNYVQSLDLDSSNKLKLYNKFSGFTAYKNGTVKY